MVDLHTKYALGLEPPNSTHQQHSNHHSSRIKTGSIYLLPTKKLKNDCMANWNKKIQLKNKDFTDNKGRI